MKDHCLAATRYWKERWKCCEIGYLNGIPLAGDELTKLIVSSKMSVELYCCQALVPSPVPLDPIPILMQSHI